jgi:hypothetical protein
MSQGNTFLIPRIGATFFLVPEQLPFWEVLKGRLIFHIIKTPDDWCNWIFLLNDWLESCVNLHKERGFWRTAYFESRNAPIGIIGRLALGECCFFS